jgi:hypothetical protein
VNSGLWVVNLDEFISHVATGKAQASVWEEPSQAPICRYPLSRLYMCQLVCTLPWLNMDRIQQLVRVCELLNCIVSELKYMNNMLDERDNYNTMEQIRQRRERSLASYRQQYERQQIELMTSI